MRLPGEAQAAGYRLVYVETTGSTNDDAASAACSGDPGRLWIVAGRQLAGRGRHGRSWASPAGNLHASLVLVEPCPLAVAPQLGFVAGLALHDAVAVAAGLAPPLLALKWPNDLLIGGAKVAGLLLEGHRIAMSRAFALVIGFGVNVATAPSGTPYPTATIASVAPRVSRDILFEALASAVVRRLGDWRESGFACIREAWIERAAGIGTEVTLRLPGRERRGCFAGLDDGGRLKLRTAAGIELIDAGDLFLSNLSAAESVRSRAFPGS